MLHALAHLIRIPVQRPPRLVRQWLVPAAGRRAGSIGAGQMARHSPVRGRATRLTGRRSERDVLDRLIDAVRAGESRALVVCGEPGVGKTALLDYLVGQAAADCRVARAAGVQSEMELPFAALQQLCAPMLDHVDRLPVLQGDALRTAFGLSAGPAPDRFLVGLAVLSLLAAGRGGVPDRGHGAGQGRTGLAVRTHPGDTGRVGAGDRGPGPRPAQ